ncbi:MAG: GAF domain-containing protein [Anaerolineales bacterium]|nr:GAF domain-containing protein [Anaerolineales bacterium]
MPTILEPENLLSLDDIIFERMPMGIALFDRQTRLLRCNPTWASYIERYTPTPAAQVKPGKTFAELAPGAEEFFHPVFERVLSGERVEIEAFRSVSGGITSYWDVAFVPLTEDGEIVGVLDVTTDATQRVEAQQELRRNEAMLRSVMENAKHFALYRIRIDKDLPFGGEVVMVSPALREMIGVDDLENFTNWFTNLHPEDEARILEANRRSLEEGRPYNEPARFHNPKTGDWTWVHTISNPQYNEQGEITHFDGMVIDLTEQKQAEAALQEAYASLEQRVAERTHEILQRQDELEALYQADQDLYQDLQLNEVLQALADIAVQSLHVDKSALLVRDPQTEELAIAAVNGFNQERISQIRWNRDEGVIGQVYASGQPVTVTDTHLDPRRQQETAPRVDVVEQEGIRSFIHIPIHVGSEIFGIFSLCYLEPHQFTPAEERLYTALAQRAAQAIENARLYTFEQERRQEEESRRKIAESLREMLRMINSNLPLAAILERAGELARLHLDASGFILHRFDFESRRVVHEAGYGVPLELSETFYTPFDMLAAAGNESFVNAALNHQPVYGNYGPLANRVAEIENDPKIPADIKARRLLIRQNFAAAMGVPLVINEEVYGGLVFYYAEPQEFPQDQIQLAQIFAEQVALAIENARLRTQAEESAVTAERNRLARDLHDAVSQTLFSASLIAEVLPRLWQRNPEEAEKRLEELRQLTRGALAEMRTLLLELRPATLLEAEMEELLRHLANAITGRARLPVDLQVDPDCELPPDVKVAFYRVAQEALNNIAKHASASQVGLSLTCDADNIRLCIEDDGLGFNPKDTRPDSLGLSIMRERAIDIGAQLEIHSQIEQGTRIELTWNKKDGIP